MRARPARRRLGGDRRSIKVGGIVSHRAFGDAMKGAQARFDRENAKGGVFGRKIEFVDTADDKFDPNTNIQESPPPRGSGEVFAIVPAVTVVLGSSDFLAQQKVPFFGWGISSGFCENEYGYGFTGCVAPKTPGVRQHVHA